MLKDKTSSAIVAVRNIARACSFYEAVLGLDLVDDAMEQVLVFRTGDSRLVVYRSDDAGTNRANAVVWSCGDTLEAIVADLEGKGVAFERYPGIGGTRLEGNIHVAGTMRMVWLKDPDGNILHLNSM